MLLKIDQIKTSFARNRSWQFFVFFGVVILILIGVVFNFFRNYAAEAARPLEVALAKAGAVKQCSRGDNGRGWDSREPDYSAVYEILGTREKASVLVLDAAKKAGFSLKRVPSPVGAPNNALYEDYSKPSKYNPEAGNTQLLVTIFASSTYAKGSKFCGVMDQGASAPSDRTTIDFTVNLPAL